MPSVTHSIVFEDRELERSEDQSVLDCLLKHNIAIASGCRSGVCQSCVLALDYGNSGKSQVDGLMSGIYQQGLPVEQQQAGYLLACCSKPEASVRLRRVNSAALRIESKVTEKFWLNDKVICLRLQTKMDYRPGQYLTLWRNESVGRSYSIASCPAYDKTLELHIQHYSDGACSHWVANELSVGDMLDLQGPMGTFFYIAKREQPLLLCAMGTGLSAILGVLKDAIANDHHGRIDVVIGAKKSSGLYLVSELRQLAAQHRNVSISFLVQECDNECDVARVSDIYQHCTSEYSDLAQRKIYLCGAESFVLKLRKKLFLAGSAFENIRADSFLGFS